MADAAWDLAEKAQRRLYESVRKERDQLAEICADQQTFIESIPSAQPDGTGCMSPAVWVRWAMRELGYEGPDHG